MQRFIDAFWNADIEVFKQSEVVRIRVLNISALTITLTMLSLIAVMLAYGGDDWTRSAHINLWLVLGLQPVFIAQRFGYLAKALYFFAWIALFVVVESSFGRINATHFTLLVMPALAVYVLGAQRWLLAAVLSVLFVLIFLCIEYMVPWQIGWHQTFYEAISSELPRAFEPGIYDLIFVAVVVVTEAIVFLGAYLTLSALRKSQEALALEYARSEMLLANMLPAAIVDRLKSNPDQTIAESYLDVTILFADLVGFTAYSSNRPAHEVVGTLTALFNVFDELVANACLEKIKTVGDAYMVAGGLDPSVEDHPAKIADLALRMIEKTRSLFRNRQIDLTLRIGVHRGPAVAGVVGNKRTFFDVWGDTVNVASRMEATAPPGRIQVTRDLMRVLQSRFQFERAEDVTIKGKGQMERYLLVARD